MILDHIESATSYAALHPHIMEGLKFLVDFESTIFVPKREEINGDIVYALLQEYESKPIESGKWESHRRYADIHFIYEGEEQIGYTSCDSLRQTANYNDRDDYALYEGNGQYVNLKKGWFAVFFPQDAHMPGLTKNNSIRVQKIVVKVKL